MGDETLVPNFVRHFYRLEIKFLGGVQKHKGEGGSRPFGKCPKRIGLIYQMDSVI